jgi:hypothetical protein
LKSSRRASKTLICGGHELSSRGHPAQRSTQSPRNQYIRAGRVRDGIAGCPRCPPTLSASPLSAVTAPRSKAGCPHSHRLTHPITNAVAVGLAIGKPLGIIVVSAIVVRLGWGNLPEGVSWLMLAGASSLAGIGFTMSLFTAGLAFEADYLLPAKSGVLVASLARALLGVLILKLATTRAMTSLTRADD